MKRTLKLKLLFLTLLCAVAQGTWAQNFDVWDGHSEEKPGYYRRADYGICLQIRSAAQMAWLMNHYMNSITYWNDWLGENKFANPYRSSIEICADIDMTAGNWTPLGRFTNSEGSRKGVYYDANPWEDDVVFNGLGHTVKIKIENATENYQGLFYGIGKRAKVANLHVMADIHCKDSRLVGGIAGENDGIIENCKVSGLVRSDYKSGLAVKGKVGGLCGENNATVRYCCVTATVQNHDAYVGGLVGCNDGTVKHCTFYGERISDHSQDTKYVGDKGKEENLYDSYQESEMSVGDYWYHYFIKYAYAIKITTVGDGTYQASIGSDTKVPGCYPGGTVTLTNTSGRNLHSISIKDAGGNDIYSYGNMNTTLDITMPKKDVYVTAVFSANWPVGGHAGSAEDPYLISSAEDWNEFAQSVYLGNTYNGRHIKLTKDISVTKSVGSCNAASDTDYKAFCGTFDGDGHTLTVNLRNQSRFGAPFKCVEGATIKNLRTAGTIDGTGNENGKLLSGLVGISIHGATITGCRSSVTLTTDFGARGYEDAALAGFVAGTKGGGVTITGCVFDGSMVGEGNKRCAGIAGYEYGGTFTTIMNTLFAPATLTVSTTDDGYTKTISRDEENLYIDNCYYTRTLGAAQGSEAIASANAPGNLGSLVKDYGMVKAYEKGLFFDGKYYFAPATSTGDGTEGDPYIIGNTDQWETFAVYVNNGTHNFSGEFVQLTADISVTTMVGTSEANSFQGTFLGNNHTLTFTKGSSESAFNEQYCAPFRYAKGATIRNLKTAGAIYTSQKFATGLISHSYGMTTITNCHVGTDIYSRVGGDGTHGAFVAYPDGPVNITGSSFKGRLLTNNGTHSCGGFVAWHNNKAITVTHSLYAPDGSIPSGWSAINNGATFVRGGEPTITGCYYTEAMGTAQGAKAYDSAAAPANLGSLVQDYGTLKVYQNGILCDGTYYAAFTLPGAGTEASPYLIGNADQWNDFAGFVTNGYTFSGKFVKLNADINVSDMAGADDANSFQGTFDGDGKTLTFTKGTSGSPFNENYSAPFRHVKNAVIRNLHTAGTITTSAMNGAGLVGESHGALTIENCRSSVAIHASKSGDGTHGGFVATLSGKDNAITIDGCVFDGSFATTAGTNGCGGFIGWPVYNKPIIRNSLMIPGGVAAGMLGGTFSRVYYEPTIDGCYFVDTENLPANQGMKAVALPAAPDNLGDLVKDYGILKAYQNGLFFDGKYYVNAGVDLPDNTDNGSAISEYNGATVDVTLTGSTFYKDGAWNTVCLPFNLTLAGSPLDGAVARPLTGASISGSSLNLTFGDAVTELKAGTPYIIKWEGGDNLVNPEFKGVTIDATDRSFDNGAGGDARVRFIGVYKSIAFDSEDKSVLLLGGANALYHPVSGAGVGALRAYFKIGDSATKASMSVDGLVLTVK